MHEQSLLDREVSFRVRCLGVKTHRRGSKEDQREHKATSNIILNGKDLFGTRSLISKTNFGSTEDLHKPWRDTVLYPGMDPAKEAQRISGAG